MRYFGTVVVLVFIHACLCNASEKQALDFAEGIVLECPEGATACRYNLPDYVYDMLVYPNYADIGMFNSDGRSVPFTLQHKESDMVSSKERQTPSELAFFPIFHEKPKDQSVGSSWSIVADSKGALINLGLESRKSVVDSNEKKTPLFYIADCSALEHMPSRLSFLWNGPENHVFHVGIDGSDDLETWNTVVLSSVLAEIRRDGHMLLKRDIPLPVVRYKYLRIKRKNETDRILFKGITAYFEEDYVKEAPRHWTRLNARKGSDSGSGTVYRLEGHRPVDRLRINFPDKNTLVNAEISSRVSHEKTWQPLFKGVLYFLDVDGSALENCIVSFSVVSHTEFRLKIDDGMGEYWEKTRLDLTAGYLPHEVIFMAQGNGPYTLAYGSGKAWNGEDEKRTMNVFLRSMDDDTKKKMVKESRFVTKKTLGGPEQLKNNMDRLTLNRMFLWIVLATAVVLCGYMALTLQRQMIREKKDSGERPS